MAPVPEIKLVRTDTTLDLSQKAEKVCVRQAIGHHNLSAGHVYTTVGPTLAGIKTTK